MVNGPYNLSCSSLRVRARARVCVFVCVQLCSSQVCKGTTFSYRLTNYRVLCAFSND